MIYQITDSALTMAESNDSVSPLAVLVILALFTLTFIVSGVFTYRIMRKKTTDKGKSSNDNG